MRCEYLIDDGYDVYGARFAGDIGRGVPGRGCSRCSRTAGGNDASLILDAFLVGSSIGDAADIVDACVALSST